MSTNLNVSESTVYYGQGAYDGMRFVKYVGLADGLGNINQSQLGYIDPDYNNEKTGDFVSSILVFLDNTNAYILM